MHEGAFTICFQTSTLYANQKLVQATSQISKEETYNTHPFTLLINCLHLDLNRLIIHLIFFSLQLEGTELLIIFYILFSLLGNHVNLVVFYKLPSSQYELSHILQNTYSTL